MRAIGVWRERAVGYIEEGTFLQGSIFFMLYLLLVLDIDTGRLWKYASNHRAVRVILCTVLEPVGWWRVYNALAYFCADGYFGLVSPL